MRVNRRKDGKTKETVAGGRPGREILFGPIYLDHEFVLALGIAHGLLDVLNKHFQGVFTMTKAESGLVQFSTYIAYFLMALPAGAFMKRYGYRKGIIMGLLLFAIRELSGLSRRLFCIRLHLS